MAKFNEKSISYKRQVELLNDFCEIIYQLKSQADIYRFLKDLLNRQERLMLIRRMLIAELLIAGATYGAIRKKLKCGYGTISKVQRWVNFGRGGYQVAVKKKKH